MATPITNALIKFDCSGSDLLFTSVSRLPEFTELLDENVEQSLEGHRSEGNAAAQIVLEACGLRMRFGRGGAFCRANMAFCTWNSASIWTGFKRPSRRQSIPNARKPGRVHNQSRAQKRQRNVYRFSERDRLDADQEPDSNHEHGLQVQDNRKYRERHFTDAHDSPGHPHAGNQSDQHHTSELGRVPGVNLKRLVKFTARLNLAL